VTITNTQGSFSTGRDVSIILVGPFGRVDLANVISFTARQETAMIKVDRLDGVQLLAELPKGWSGTIEVERGNAAIDVFFGLMEAAWIDGGTYTVSTLFQYVRDTNSVLNTYAYDNVGLKLDDAGDYKPDAAVRQRISWSANRRRPL
jgi:hypothetical protein